MGIDYSHSAGYGIVLTTYDDNFEELARKLKVVPYGYESYEAFVAEVPDEGERADYFDAYKVIEFICKKYGLNFATAGDSYSGELCYLIGDAHSDNFWFEPIAGGPSHPFDVGTLNVKLHRLMDDLDISRTIGYYSGMHIY